MTSPIFLARGRDVTFDAFTAIAAPLGGTDEAGRESRVFPGGDGSPGVTYASHVLQLAVRTEDMERAAVRGRAPMRPDLFILMSHGGGQEIIRLPSFYGGARLNMVTALTSLPEVALYAFLYTLYKAACSARDVAADEERQQWTRAAIDKRIRQRSYPARGVAKVWIEPKREAGESDDSFHVRKRLAAPSKRGN